MACDQPQGALGMVLAGSASLQALRGKPLPQDSRAGVAAAVWEVWVHPLDADASDRRCFVLTPLGGDDRVFACIFVLRIYYALILSYLGCTIFASQ